MGLNREQKDQLTKVCLISLDAGTLDTLYTPVQASHAEHSMLDRLWEVFCESTFCFSAVRVQLLLVTAGQGFRATSC